MNSPTFTLPLPTIPWLVQATEMPCDRLTPVWEMIHAKTARLACLEYCEQHQELKGTFLVHVAPSSLLLRHPNGMPIACHCYTVKRQEESAGFAA